MREPPGPAAQIEYPVTRPQWEAGEIHSQQGRAPSIARVYWATVALATAGQANRSLTPSTCWR